MPCVQVVFGAVVEASCCKKKKAWKVDADDIDFDELEPDLQIDEEWQHLGELLLLLPFLLFLLLSRIIF